jgi:hypothetical protein
MTPCRPAGSILGWDRRQRKRVQDPAHVALERAIHDLVLLHPALPSKVADVTVAA